MSPIHHNITKGTKTRERLRLATFRLKSFLWLEDSEDPIPGFGFVSDFSETGVGVYVGEKLTKGSHLRVSFETDHNESFRGTIIWCNRYTLTQKFVGHKTLSYRAGIKFVFVSEAERQRYIKYYKAIKERAVIIKPGMKF